MSTQHVKNVIIAGIGGQGNIVASHLLAEAALMEGKKVKLAETYGAATRGGSVLSHVRIGEAWSPRIPEGQADIILALEPLEGLRVALKYLKSGGWVLVNNHPIFPFDVTIGKMIYPNLDTIKEAMERLGGKVIIVDATRLALEAGSERSVNIVMLGCLFGIGILDLSEGSLFQTMGVRWSTQVSEINQRAFELGKQEVRDKRAQ